MKAVCKYAFDAENDQCSACDGITLKIDGEEIPSIRCGGFEPNEDAVEDVEDVEEENDAPTTEEAEQVDQVDEDAAPFGENTYWRHEGSESVIKFDKDACMNDVVEYFGSELFVEITEDVYKKAIADEKKETAKRKREEAKKEKEAKKEEVKEEQPKTENTSEVTYTSKGRVSKISCMSGATIQKNDTYYKFNYLQEVSFEGIDNFDIEAEKEILWQQCHDQIDKQIEDLN